MNLFTYFVNLLKRLSGVHQQNISIQNFKNEIKREIEYLKVLSAQACIHNLKNLKVGTNIKAAEFKVFSQFGEDGIIQYLVNNCNIQDHEKTFVEIGVEDYQESNTRFLLMNNNWSGVLIDQSKEATDTIKNSELVWRYDLKVICSKVTKENINSTLSKNVPAAVGLLSIDIDGNDYWVWQAITCIEPVIVVIEYNSALGEKKALTVPYSADFDRATAHYSWLYWGASIAAFNSLAASKGYCLLGANSSGNNLFFVKKERLGDLLAVSSQEGFVRSKFRDSRSKSGTLSFLDTKAQEDILRGLIYIDLENNKEVSLAEI